MSQKEVPAIDRNIAAMHRVRTNSDEERGREQKFVDGVTVFIGSTRSLYFHLGIYGAWLCGHLLARNDARMSLETISFTGTMEAIFLSIFVLINQRRMNATERTNADLHMQMSLLAEHEITRLAQITDMIAKRLFVDTSVIEDLDQVKSEIGPDEMLAKISDLEKKS